LAVFLIYDSFSLRVDGVKETFPRGHGLGMANALTTIMQCATFHYLIAEGELSGDVSALFYNDDMSDQTFSLVCRSLVEVSPAGEALVEQTIGLGTNLARCS